MKKIVAALSLLVTSILSQTVVAGDLTSEILAHPSMLQQAGQQPQASTTPAATPLAAPVTPVAVKPAAGKQVPEKAPVNTTVKATAADETPPAIKSATSPEPSVDDYVVEILPPDMTAVAASPLLDILAQAYTTSPTLRAARENLRAQYENVAIADAYKRPNISVGAGVTPTWGHTKPGGSADYNTRDASLSATQYLYRGGRTLAEVERQLHLSDAAMASYDAATQSTLLGVVSAALDIQRDRATIDLTKKNREVIAKSLESATRSFDVGELTRTDVAQAQARLAGADADLVVARANLDSSLARYQQLTGQDGSNLDVPLSMPALVLPATPDEAQDRAAKTHPDLRAARLAEQAAQSAVRVAQGGLLPEVSLNGTLSKAWEPTSALDENRAASVGVRATMPLYEGGATRAAIRQAKLGQYAKQNNVEDAARTVRKGVVTAWNDHQASLAAIAAYEKQVQAATLARDGVYKEREVGTRTVLDTLNADAELLDAQVGLVRAQHDAVVTAFGILAATGGMTGDALGFSTKRTTDYLETARGTVWGTNVAPLE